MSSPTDPDDDLLFADEEPFFAEPFFADGGQPVIAQARPTWKVLIADDEEEVHAVTKFTLRNFIVAGRELEFLDAYSGAEAVETIRRHDDIAVVLLDVVMETEHAGLDAVRRIREEVGDRMVRIVLRTGQPGLAPERQVITDHDINGYTQKTELTIEKLYSTMHTAVRSYRDIRALDENRRGLQRIVEATTAIVREHTLSGFASGALAQLQGLLYLGKDAARCSGVVATSTAGGSGVLMLLAGVGDYAGKEGRPVADALSPALTSALRDAAAKPDGICVNGVYSACLESRKGDRALLGIEAQDPMAPVNPDLLGLFGRNLAVAFENLTLHQDIEETQRDIVLMLSEAMERRSHHVGHHARRVGEYARLLGRAAGLGVEEAGDLALAASLHDIGKVAIPDAILNKPGPLDEEERAIMRTHSRIGHDILVSSRRSALKRAAVVALTHHERWDGQGYPQGLSGETIPLEGRIVALADAFDALLSVRPYKLAWPLDRVLEHLRGSRGTAFDPALVDLFFANLDAIDAIRARFRDEVP
ncbi:response regulator [Azospirillum soli]|uniref:response regulator n=1 Tax=Azospirillum soli TaxID=1304799 RepID=UPI001AE9222F|nr:response regulator [Azospirillum soli]MBP2312124.1 response regulator RpfG family c-di-GMP phosphodiesterase [Azospirillum soli]